MKKILIIASTAIALSFCIADTTAQKSEAVTYFKAPAVKRWSPLNFFVDPAFLKKLQCKAQPAFDDFIFTIADTRDTVTVDNEQFFSWSKLTVSLKLRSDQKTILKNLKDKVYDVNQETDAKEALTRLYAFADEINSFDFQNYGLKTMCYCLGFFKLSDGTIMIPTIRYAENAWQLQIENPDTMVTDSMLFFKNQ